jgi:hypothetical protein
MANKKKYTIEIEITCDDKTENDSGYENSLNEVVTKLKEGYHMGRDGNEDEEYSFAIVNIENTEL